MIINKKRINNIEKYLCQITNDTLYLCVEKNKENINKIKFQDLEDGSEFIPAAIGPETKKNANGYRIVHKERDKENREIEHSYHIKDWHGNFHDGICSYNRLCYPFESVHPTCYPLIIDKNTIRSELINKKDKEILKTQINIFLEIFGYVNITDNSLNSLCKKTIKKVPWTILPIGDFPWDKRANEIIKNIEKMPKKYKNIIKCRYETILKYNPDNIYVGNDYFNGYVVFEFKKKKLFLLESDILFNATYIFKNNWEELSKLTKKDILKGKLCFKRLIHNKSWIKEIEKILNN